MKKILILIVGLILLSGCVRIAELSGIISTKTEILYNVSEAGVKYELKIIEEFEENELVRVIVNLKDNSGIEVLGTKDKRIELSKQRDEWFKPRIDEVLSTLPKDGFQLTSKSSDGFDGIITKKSFDKLIRDKRVGAIYKDMIVEGF